MRVAISRSVLKSAASAPEKIAAKPKKAMKVVRKQQPAVRLKSQK